DNLSRTEVAAVSGEVLTEAFQVFLGQTNRIYWGKAPYALGENGGISGMAINTVTRAEDNPQYAVAEEWEPGIPRVQINLYVDGDTDKAPVGDFPGTGDLDWDNDGVLDQPDGIIDDVNGDGEVTLADVDNYPLGWSAGGAKGQEDLDRNGNGIFNAGDAIQFTYTDSWDDNQPTGCPGDTFFAHGVPTDCYDGLRNWNQVRPGVFDGGYLLSSYIEGGVDSGGVEITGLPSGTYIVEAGLPLGYQHLAEEHKNVDFGDEFLPSPLLLPPEGVNYDENGGLGHLVPAELTLFPGIAAPFAGDYRPLCDRKEINLTTALNAAADFHLVTEVPKAARVVGFILNDIGNEFDPNSPNFGEKFAPQWLPVSIRDWTGREVGRTYSDEWGRYNALLPSTFTASLPIPSGMGPNMLTVVINSSHMPDPDNPGSYIKDPFHNPSYSQFSYTFQYMPGSTTYLDTPVLPVAAFVGQKQFPLDCEFPDGTPVISRVSSPYVSGSGSTLQIFSAGSVQVTNPEYDGPNGTKPSLIPRDYSFGGGDGTVTIGGIEQDIQNWTSDLIIVTIADGTPTGQLMITRLDSGVTNIMGLTITVGADNPPPIVQVEAGGSIQAAIDAAAPGSLILVPPGEYMELVVLYKDVMLQGYGAPSTTINAVKVPSEKLTAWRAKIEALLASGAWDILTGQEQGAAFLEPVLLGWEQGPGITVLSKSTGLTGARIDGFTVTGGDFGGGIFVNGNVGPAGETLPDRLVISNNKVTGNYGHFHGGIRLGHPTLEKDAEYIDSHNDNITIRYNHISKNGAFAGVGGGISVCTGADNYTITRNYICGNFSAGDGGGIGHLGKNDNGQITQNYIAFNQTFNQGLPRHGGGVYISGQVPPPDDYPILGPPAPPVKLSDGAGTVLLDGNVIQGNMAGAGNGGGVSLRLINGQDVAGNGEDRGLEDGYGINLFNNVIVNNIAGLAGGGVSLEDAVNVRIYHNTIAYNDSTATAGLAFTNGISQSNPQPAGLVSHGHSAALLAALGIDKGEDGSHANPELMNNIFWQNRSWRWDSTLGNGTGGLAFVGYHDLAVLPRAAGRKLEPRDGILTDTTGYDGSTLKNDPMFVSPYSNSQPTGHPVPFEPTTGLQAAAAIDEGGNFIDVHFGPLTPSGDYHIQAGSAAINRGSKDPVDEYALLEKDIDGDPRPSGTEIDGEEDDEVDIGADEFVQTAAQIAKKGCFISTMDNGWSLDVNLSVLLLIIGGLTALAFFSREADKN
ncbi:MAG: hypothetical protein JRD68_03110, partial [Deltaproteobacteria bacterium]|nr:hypothetical protein [Deltaproteobacteria bacterium]